MREKFEALFKPEFDTKGIALPGRWEKAGKLHLEHLAAQNGWLSLTWLQAVGKPARIPAGDSRIDRPPGNWYWVAPALSVQENKLPDSEIGWKPIPRSAPRQFRFAHSREDVAVQTARTPHMDRWVEIQFDCLPLRSVSRWDATSDASPKFRDFCARLAEAHRRHGTHNAYFLHNARCVYHLTNHPDLGMLEFRFEGVVLTGRRRPVAPRVAT